MKKILFIDTLTTGMNTERCAIYRIAGIYVEDGVEKLRFDIKTRPFASARISEQSLWIGKVDRSILASYPDQKSAFDTFISILDRCVDVRNSKDKLYLAGFNAATFDMPFLREWFLRNNNLHFRDYFYMQILDVMTIAGFVMMDERAGMRDFKLESVAAALSVPVYEDEGCDCLTNAKTTLDVYREIKTGLGLEEFLETNAASEIIRNF